MNIDLNGKNLTTLIGQNIPKQCNTFICSFNKKLTSLEGGPSECEKYYCSYCDLTSLKFAPKKCDSFWFYGNKKLSLWEMRHILVCDIKKIEADTDAIDMLFNTFFNSTEYNSSNRKMAIIEMIGKLKGGIQNGY